jgi:hypothetical protein
VKAFVSYVCFTTGTTLILRVALALPVAGLVVALIVGAAAAVLAVRRMREAPLAPLMYDDELPTDVNPLRLYAD